MPTHFSLTEDEEKYLLRSLILNYADNLDDFDREDISKGNNVKENLIGRLIRRSDINREFYSKIRRQQYSSKESLKNRLFMGAGYHSLVQKNNLHERLEFAASELCGLQQNGGQGTTFDQEMDKECKDNIKSVLKDIIYAFNIPVEELV